MSPFACICVLLYYQCDIKNSGLADCLQFDARSCEHINMLVQRKLVPDIKAIQRKHSSWEPEKQVQGK